MENRNNYKFIARIKVESLTPLFVGSGNDSLLKDAIVQKDFRGLPVIPGTALAGVLRHSFLDLYKKSDLVKYSQKEQDRYFNLLDLFGAQFRERSSEEKSEKELFTLWYKKRNKVCTSKIPDGLGSRLKVSTAYFILQDGKVAEDLTTQVDPNIVARMTNLPLRKHVRISDKGVAKKSALFDNEVVYKGARFLFEIELTGTQEDKDIWVDIINSVKSPLFRIGQGTRNGYGRLKVTEVYNKVYDINVNSEFDEYLNFDPSFNSTLKFEKVDQTSENNCLTYKLSLKPDCFFIFSDGFGDNEVENKPLKEEVIKYNNGNITFDEHTVIPAASIKGAISHRVAFHYNKLKKCYADKTSDLSECIEDNNRAVKLLFGYKSDSKSKGDSGSRGVIVMDDLFYDNIDNEKIFNHVAIDRFTGGAINGALFSEKVSSSDKIEFLIYITHNDIEKDILQAFEEALKDICKGLLPLGGMTTKGHGMFTGELWKNDESIFAYKIDKLS